MLVAGGQDNTGKALASAEVYDPRHDQWHEVAAMSSARVAASAAVLHDGRVLVAGGAARNGVDLQSAEIYDPRTDRWAATPPMHRRRSFATATLLGDGRVIVVGGDTSDVPSTAEIYDPRTHHWHLTPPLRVNLTYHAAVPLDGSVLVVGGAYDNPQTAPDEEWFDVHRNRWVVRAPMRERARVYHTATLLRDGRVLVVGGMGLRDQWLASAEVYDPHTNRWHQAGSLPHGLINHLAVRLRDGRVLVCGGMPKADDARVRRDEERETFLYDPATNRWENGPRLPRPFTQGAAAVLLPAGAVLVTGGAEPFGAPARAPSAVLYRP